MFTPQDIINKIYLALGKEKDIKHGIQPLTNALLLDQKTTTLPSLIDTAIKIYTGLVLLENIIYNEDYSNTDIPNLFTAIMAFMLSAEMNNSKNTSKFFSIRLKALENIYNSKRKDLNDK